ncbi:MAG: hypothetical protein ACLR1P_10015 [Oscillospiraceae bacterium]
MLAEHLGLPQLTCACAITIEDGAIRIRQEGERAYRALRAPLLAVVTVVKTINEPRLPNVMRKLQANRMQPQTLTAGRSAGTRSRLHRPARLTDKGIKNIRARAHQADRAHRRRAAGGRRGVPAGAARRGAHLAGRRRDHV